jgi:hypothetical protein
MTTGGTRAYNDRIESFRNDEYPMLKGQSPGLIIFILPS